MKKRGKIDICTLSRVSQLARRVHSLPFHVLFGKLLMNVRIRD